MKPIPMTPKLTFNDLFDNDKIRPLKWGDEFVAWPMRKQLEFAKALAAAMNEAADKMQQHRDEIYAELTRAHALVEQAEAQRDIAKKTLTANITLSNQKHQELQEEIMLLRRELKEAREAA